MSETEQQQLNTIFSLFPELTEQQRSQLAALADLYRDWNAKINVISRKDIDNLYLHHVLHSLGIAKVVKFRAGTSVLDVGTGGGFPGIPLAIMFPQVRFKLIDSTGKKIKVVESVIGSLGLNNATAQQLNAAEERERFDFVVSRAVMPTNQLVQMVRKNIARTQRNPLPNGVICLKGGNIEAELAGLGKRRIDTWRLTDFFKDEYFDGKLIVYINAL